MTAAIILCILAAVCFTVRAFNWMWWLLGIALFCAVVGEVMS